MQSRETRGAAGRSGLRQHANGDDGRGVRCPWYEAEGGGGGGLHIKEAN